MRWYEWLKEVVTTLAMIVGLVIVGLLMARCMGYPIP